MLKIAICDDEENICTQIEDIILDYSKFTKQKITVEIFNSGNKLCDTIQHDKIFDLIFLDIEMEDCNGIVAGNIIRSNLNSMLTNIVYISWKDKYCKELFQIRPLNFLQKPLSEKLIIKEIEYVLQLSSSNKALFSFKHGNEILKIPYNEIISFESQDKIVILSTAKECYRFYDTIDNISTMLESNKFIRIHKSCIVNYSHITKFKYDEVELTNLQIFSISQSKRKAVRAIQLSLEKEDL